MYLTACSYKKTSTWAGSSVYSCFRYHSLWKLKWEQVSCSKSSSLGVKGNLNWWVDEWAAAAGIEFQEPLCSPQNRCKPFLCHTHTQSSDRDRKPDIFFFSVCWDWTLMGHRASCKQSWLQCMKSCSFLLLESSGCLCTLWGGESSIP